MTIGLHLSKGSDMPGLPASALAIETRGLTRRFGARYAVQSLDLRVPRGAIYGFVGPNGAGKTTTIKLILGLLRPTAGSALLNGERLTPNRRDLLRGVGALMEVPSLYPHLTGRENLDLTRRILDLSASEVLEALAFVTLTADADRLVRTYSLGMRQRLALARAWLGHPHLLLLDEPANSLDPVGIRELRAHLRRLAQERGVTVFLSSHVLSEVEQVATDLGIINEGRLLFQGTLQELRQRQGASAEDTLEDLFLRVVSTGEEARSHESPVARPVG
jgi:lantibiotic transport system ATP-binding protein